MVNPHWPHLYRLFLVLTNRCGARCKLCRYWQTSPNVSLSLSFIRTQVVPFINKHHIQAICLTGGEPTTHDFLPEIIAALSQTGATLTLITNGERLQTLFPQIGRYIHAWLLSLDADNKELHQRIRGLDNFDDLIAWPKKIKTTFPSAQIAFNCLIQKLNVRHLVSIYDLVSNLPCDGIFFNVPDLNRHAFGRETIDPVSYKKYANLDDNELKILQSNLQTIREKDTEYSKLMQGEIFFAKCIDYFQYLNGGTGSFKDHRQVCEVPLTSLVIDENERVLRCFYYQPEPVAPAGDIGIIDPLLLQQRAEEFLQNADFREKYCRHCFQFQA